MNSEPPRRARPPKGADSATYLALMGLVMVSVVLVGISALVLPQIAGLIAVIAGFSLFVVFQYLLLGRFMSGIGADENDDAEPKG